MPLRSTPLPTRPSIAIVGAGAVGGYYGARLVEHGHSVHFLLRSDYEHVRRNGLKITSTDGNLDLPAEKVQVYNDPAAMPKVDLVLVTLKSTENRQFQRLISPLLRDDTAILTLQNGLGNEDDLIQLFGPDRVLGGMAFVCINRVGPGRIEHVDHGYIRLGEFTGPGRSPRSESIAALLTGCRIDAGVLDDLRAGRWEKLVWNIPFNGLGTLLSATTDQLIDSEPGVRLVRAIMEEVRATAEADGVKIAADVPDRKIKATRPMGRYRTSTQIDRETGRPMEIDAIFTRPLAVARQAGIPVPLLEMLHFSLSALNRANSA